MLHTKLQPADSLSGSLSIVADAIVSLRECSAQDEHEAALRGERKGRQETTSLYSRIFTAADMIGSCNDRMKALEPHRPEI